MPLHRYLEELSDSWLRLARIKIKDSEREKDPMGQRLIRHGGFCYFNCAMDIKRLLGTVEDVSCDHASEVFKEDIESP